MTHLTKKDKVIINPYKNKKKPQKDPNLEPGDNNPTNPKVDEPKSPFAHEKLNV